MTDDRELHPICPLGHYMKVKKVENQKVDCVFCKEGQKSDQVLAQYCAHCDVAYCNSHTSFFLDCAYCEFGHRLVQKDIIDQLLVCVACNKQIAGKVLECSYRRCDFKFYCMNCVPVKKRTVAQLKFLEESCPIPLCTKNHDMGLAAYKQVKDKQCQKCQAAPKAEDKIQWFCNSCQAVGCLDCYPLKIEYLKCKESHLLFSYQPSSSPNCCICQNSDCENEVYYNCTLHNSQNHRCNSSYCNDCLQMDKPRPLNPEQAGKYRSLLQKLEAEYKDQLPEEPPKFFSLIPLCPDKH